jgi:DNA-binding transcriptional LysR family regulator
MDLDALQDFDVVASHGGFAAAARLTGRPKASLSRRVRQLEDALGVRLFERGAHALRMTDEGLALHARIHALLEQLDDATDATRADAGHPSGRLRVSVPGLLAQRGLGRIAAAYVARYPRVQLEVNADDRFIDPVVDGYDLVIRANPKPDTELSGRCFLRDTTVLVAAPSIARPRRAEAPVPAVVLSAAAGVSELPYLNTRGQRRSVHLQSPLRLSSMNLVFDAVLAGAGVAAMPRSLVQGALDDGRLLLWGSMPGRTIEVWALYPSRRHVSRKVAAFVSLLMEHFPEGRPPVGLTTGT